MAVRRVAEVSPFHIAVELIITVYVFRRSHIALGAIRFAHGGAARGGGISLSYCR